MMKVMKIVKDNPLILVGCLVLVGVIVMIVMYTRSGFNSADGVVARRAQHQVRDDTQNNSSWDLKKLESDVELINRT
jgi:hypothetical protein